MSQWNGTYHLFYQYNPEGAFHHRILWGHAASTDLVNWTDKPVALEPSEGPDADGCWSGVLVDDGGTPTLVYSGRRGERELPCVAVGSPDLLSWTKAPENPVIPAPPAGVDITAYRDHCVWREGAVWRQLVGSGIRGRGGTAFLYESADLRRWDYIGPLFIGDAASGDPAATDWPGTMWECVDLFRADGGALGRPGDGHRRARLLGLARRRHPPPALLDRTLHGGFVHAPRAAPAGLRRPILLCPAVLCGRGRAEAAMVEAGWCGVMSLPRVATLDAEGELAFAAVPEMESLRRDHVRIGPRSLGASEVLAGVSGNQLDLELDLEMEPGSVFRLGILGTSTSMPGRWQYCRGSRR